MKQRQSAAAWALAARLRTAKALFIAAALAGALASCNNALAPKASAPEESGGILVRIVLPGTGTGARTAMPTLPDYASLGWTITASAGARTVQSEGRYPDLRISLPYEEVWKFTVRVADAAGKEIFYGQTTREITHGDAELSVALGPGAAMQGGTGSINLTIRTADDTEIAAVYCRLEPTGSTDGGGNTDTIAPLTGSGGVWTISRTAPSGTYLLYLYFTETASDGGGEKTVYVTAEAVNVWNGAATDRWEKTGNTRYLIEENGETAFVLTQDIIDSFKKSVGTAVYVSENGFGGQDGIGSVIAPVRTLSQAFAVLDGESGSIIVDGYIAVAEEEILANNQSVTVLGAGSGGTLVNENGRVFTVGTGSSLTLGAGITLTGANTSAAGGDGGAVCVTGGALTMQDGSAITDSHADNGGAVYVDGGTFTMEGGAISGNTAVSNGGGVCINGGSFTMTGGAISGGNSAVYGGGVCMNGGAFTVSGSVQVTGNTGGNVYLASGQTMTVGGLAASARLGVKAADTGSGLIPVTDKAAANAQSIFTSDDAAYEILAADGTAVYLFSETKAAADGDALYVGSNGSVAIGSLTDAVKSANSSGGTITLLKNISGSMTSYPITFSGSGITLDLNGKTINRGGSGGSVITVTGSLTLTGSGTITGGYSGGVYVDGGTFTMEGGTISDNYATYGGGVAVLNGGRFTMTNGTISGNRGTVGNGVYVEDGSTFTMTGGTIDNAVTDFDRNEFESSAPVYQWPPS